MCNGCLQLAVQHNYIIKYASSFTIVTKSRRLSLPLDILFELFDRVVLPVVLYANKIYGHTCSYLCIKKLEIFLRSLYKKALS